MSEKLICKICGLKAKTIHKITGHITKLHKISLKDYYDKYFKSLNEDICMICGKDTKFKSLKNGYKNCCCNSCAIKNSWKDKEKDSNKFRIENNRKRIEKRKGIKWNKKLPSKEERHLNFCTCVEEKFKDKEINRTKDLTCKICGYVCKSVKSLSAHISQTHCFLIKDYYDFFIKNENEGICIICGSITSFRNYSLGYNEFCSSMKCVTSDPKRIENNKKYFKEHREEIRNQRSVSAKRQWRENEEYIELMTTSGNEYRQKQSKRQKEKYTNNEERKKTSENIKKAYNDRPELRKKASEHAKRMWEDPNSKFNSEEYSKNQLKSRENRPTKPEKKIINLLDELGINMFKYTGDGTFWINNKNPDFVNKESKKVIEVFGDYWHSEKVTGTSVEEHVDERYKYFSEKGYKTLILWENEILNNINDVTSKILSFIEEL